MKVVAEVQGVSASDGAPGVLTLEGQPTDWSWHVEATSAGGYMWEVSDAAPPEYAAARAKLEPLVCDGKGGFLVRAGKILSFEI